MKVTKQNKAVADIARKYFFMPHLGADYKLDCSAQTIVRALTTAYKAGTKESKNGTRNRH